MVNDPHQVLGVSPGASADDIKKAYRKKAKECHPDLHPDDPNATQKMNEVNEAYDMLMHPEKYQGRAQQQYSGSSGRQGNPYQQYGPYQNPFGQQGGWQSGGAWFDFDDIFGFGASRQANYQPPQEMPFDSMEVRTAIRAINMRKWQEAINALVRVPSAGRNARWHYLFALAQDGAGNTMTAQEEMQRAVQMEPNNDLYYQLLQQYRQAGRSYEQRSRGFNMSAMDPTRWCMGMCLANLLCNFCRCC